MLSENCYDEDELCDRYFKLCNVNREACRYSNPFEGKINSQILEPLFPEPKIVEKIIKVPVEKIIEKIVEKEVKVPVEKIVEKIIEKEVKVPDPMDEQKLSVLIDIKTQLQCLNGMTSRINENVYENGTELSAMSDILLQLSNLENVSKCAYMKLSSIDQNIASLEIPDVSKELSGIICELSNVIGNVPYSKALKGIRTIAYNG